MPLWAGKWTMEVVMRVSKCLGLLAIGLLLGGTALAEVPNVYVSYPDGGGVYVWNGVTLESVPDFARTYEDMVIAPDGSLSACNPLGNGLQCGW